MAEDQNRSMQDKFMLRLPDGMRDRLKEEAKKSGRSLNAEIVHRLANTLNFPRFEDMGFDFGFGFDENLNFELLNRAGQNGRSVTEEIVYRLNQSLMSHDNVVLRLEDETWAAKQKLDKLMRLFIQMTPEERRILEERAEVIERAKDWKLSSTEIAKLTELFRIGGKGRIPLTKPPADYSTLLARAMQESRTYPGAQSTKSGLEEKNDEPS